MAESKTVNIHCSIRGGLVLRTFTRFEPKFGEPVMQADGPGHGLHYGMNEGIDREFFDKWVKQNTTSPLRGHVTLVEEKK